MKRYALIVFSIMFFSCSTATLTSVAIDQKLPTKEDDILESKPHTNYTIKKDVDAYPESIIFIIADGTGIGQYTLSYYANGEFAPARLPVFDLSVVIFTMDLRLLPDLAASRTFKVPITFVS